jgi:hypothetical protein
MSKYCGSLSLVWEAIIGFRNQISPLLPKIFKRRLLSKNALTRQNGLAGMQAY